MPAHPYKNVACPGYGKQDSRQNRLERIMHTIPIRQNKRGWNCVAWVQEALERLTADGKALCTLSCETDVRIYSLLLYFRP